MLNLLEKKQLGEKATWREGEGMEQAGIGLKLFYDWIDLSKCLAEYLILKVI